MDGSTAEQRRPVIVITGAAGYTGMHACRHFAKLGWEVAALTRTAASVSELILLARDDENNSPEAETRNCITPYVCDLLDKKRLGEVIRQIAPDYVLHLGGKNSVPESWESPLLYMESNVLSTLYLLDVLRPFPKARIVVAGSRLKTALQAPYHPTHPYSLSKSLQEAVALSWGALFEQSVMLAEPCNLIGPGPSTGFCALLAGYIVQTERREGQSATETVPFRVSSRHAQRDFLDVRDAVRAYGVLLEQGVPGRVYSVCTGRIVELGNIVERMVALAKTSIPIQWGDVAESASTEAYRAKELEDMGWKPTIQLRQSLEDMIQYRRAGKEGTI
ncbi:NAD-dependent epimerase/dehydratase family protein [Paenibacillus sp. SEL3]|jgi:GDP-4-dehydro-6-deoxy-D-mannose reductase|uniref:NAD-dependent epimerase/dehydratase family protein n=1 Tax=Paenibacillus polymyxa TaxID=1406 RepID=A0A8I1LVJ0_PAEPO|nr:MULTISPECIES: NAD-dependent epimerase/dehydratase family protein [Paenibacillus]KAF6572935.1 NAD-dependent epimerase/dehydratase family protein [Paenibacillus sp. EKM206P]KAF6587601.1 NAD-dependent epimerase/dehydratase family protein [Paenibacillus sp. EKM205P]KEO77942.1 nucleoside-diphosphate sugar epimerase [Paenibacillus polymyxa]MBM0633792.1 NAD-dependent epimerase/dehydratase family protein [Paenibacillus polymyxa]MBO3285751.1 NAD-dependent epimerase/dehydratase family protein [Paenib